MAALAFVEASAHEVRAAAEGAVDGLVEGADAAAEEDLEGRGGLEVQEVLAALENRAYLEAADTGEAH